MSNLIEHKGVKIMTAHIQLTDTWYASFQLPDGQVATTGTCGSRSHAINAAKTMIDGAMATTRKLR